MQALPLFRERRPETAPPRKAKGGFTRQRLGCLTCRRRKKKCDMLYPICGHCTRLNLVCKRESPRELSEQTAHGDAGPPPDAVPLPGSPTALPAATDSVSSARDTQLSDLLQHADIWLAHGPSEAPYYSSSNSVDLTASRRIMMRYYVQIFAFMLTTNLENNCFLSVLLPMAFECPTLMKALSAWSSSHLSLREPTFTDVALQHRGSALRNFKATMEDGELSTEMALAITMVFCSMEAIYDGTDSWYHHLSGGAAVLCSNSLTVPSSTGHLAMSKEAAEALRSYEGKWLLRNFAYHDIMMSITMDRRPFLRGDYWVSTDLDAAADPYFGLAEHIIYLVSEVSHLNADMAAAAEDALARRTSETQGYIFNTFSARALVIEDELREWQCRSACATPLVSLAESYRSAARIHLYRTIRRHVPDVAKSTRAKIAQQVVNIVRAVANMPQGCLPECTLLFPLFMAGGEAEEPDHILVIRERLVSMNRWRRFRNVEASLDVLDELWRLKAAEARSEDKLGIDWLDVLKRREWKLSIS